MAETCELDGIAAATTERVNDDIGLTTRRYMLGHALRCD